MKNKKIIILFLLVLSFFQSFSQTEKELTDSLNVYVKKLTALTSFSDYASQENTIDKGLYFAKKLKSDSLLSDFYNAKSLYCLNVHLKEDALRNIDSSIFYAKKTGDKDYIINSYNTKGFIYEHLFEFDKASEWVYKTITYINKEGSPKDKIAPLVNLSNIYIKSKDYQNAEKALLEALQLSKNENNEWTILVCTQSLGVVSAYLENLKDSEKYYRALIVLARNLEKISNEADALTGLAHIFLKQNKLDSAKFYYQKSFEIYSKLENYRYSYYPYLNFGKFYTKLYEKTGLIKDINEAILHLDTAYKKAVQNENLEGQQRTLHSLSNIYYLTNNYQLAYDNLIAYNAIKDSVFTIEKEKIIKNYDAKYELSEKENENFKLNVVNLKVEKKAANLKNTIIIGSIILLLLLIVLVGIVFYNKYKKKIAHQEQQNKEHLQKAEFEKFKSKALTEKIDAAEHERDRISRELHDNIAGKLFVMKSKMNDSTKTQNELEGLNVALRKLIANLSKPIFEDVVSLEESLTLFLNESLANTKISYELDVVLENEHKMKEELKFDFYRISQELIMNAIKHSEASQIAVAILEEENKIELIVKDNGQGFNNSSVGHGYSNIATRLKKYKAQLRKTSSNGAEITINIDL